MENPEAVTTVVVMVGKPLSLILSLILSVCAFAQTDKQSYFQFVENNYYSNQDSVIQLYQDGFKFNYGPDSTAWLLNYTARAYTYKARYQQAINIIEKELEPLKELITEQDLFYDVDLLKAYVLVNQEEYILAGSIFNEVLKVLPEDMIRLKSSTHINYSLVFWELGNFDEYFNQTNLGLEYAEKGNDTRRQIIALNNLAEYYEIVKYDYEKARELYNKAEQLKGEAPQLETILRLKIRRAVQLRDIDKEYQIAEKLLAEAKFEAKTAGLMQLYESANWALLRNRYLISEYEKQQLQFMIQYLIAAGLALTMLIIWVRKRRNPDWKKIQRVFYKRD